MKKILNSFLLLSTLSLVFSGMVLAQDDDRMSSVVSEAYVISAKAGGVNFVEGKVTVARKNARSGYLLKGDKLEVGDRVTTGAESRAEILLNPGSFARLGVNTEFEFANTSLDDLALNIKSGSAMFEVFADDEFKVTVNTPKGRFYLVDSGIYRIDVLANGVGKISVWKGEAQVGDMNATEVKKGRTATFDGEQVAIEKFDRDEKDALEEWSKERAKYLAKVNSRLRRDDVRGNMISSFGANRWGLYDSFGLWVFDRFSGAYCFVPFGYGWSSPYGYWFNRSLWYFRMPQHVYIQQPTVRNNTGTGNTGTIVREPRQTRVPPFQRVQKTVDRRVPASEVDFSPSSVPTRTSNFPSSVPAAPARNTTPMMRGGRSKGDN